MKSFLHSTMAWLNSEAAGPEQSVPQVETPSASVPGRPTPPPFLPNLSPEVIVETDPAPELKLSVRGAKLYGACPHCTATWGVRERLERRSRRGLDALLGLTCPACEKSVTLPDSPELRRIN